jgi:hypothetical protein
MVTLVSILLASDWTVELSAGKLAPNKECSAATTCAPSPTAAATRFTFARRSPMANTPGRVVSNGWRLFDAPLTRERDRGWS